MRLGRFLADARNDRYSMGYKGKRRRFASGEPPPLSLSKKCIVIPNEAKRNEESPDRITMLHKITSHCEELATKQSENHINKSAKQRSYQILNLPHLDHLNIQTFCGNVPVKF